MKTKDEWLDDMELRMKRALLDVMDLPEDESRSFLQQELRSHLEDVNGEESRLDYLKSLKERFPQMASMKSSRVTQFIEESPEPRSEESVESSPEEIDVVQALEIVRRDWEQLSEDARLDFIKEFTPEGTKPTAEVKGASDMSESAKGKPSDELARFLKLPADSDLSLDRLQSALVSILKTVSQVDSLGTQVYKQVGLSRDLSSEDIRKMVGEYVGSDSVELKKLNETLDETRMKVGLTISAIADLSQTLSQSHLSKFQPAMIEKSVGSSGGGFLASNEAKCWKKYISLAEDIQPQKMEKAINDLIIKQLKKLKRR